MEVSPSASVCPKMVDALPITGYASWQVQRDITLPPVVLVVVVVNVLERMGSIYFDRCGLRRGILDLLREQLIHLEDYAKSRLSTGQIQPP